MPCYYFMKELQKRTKINRTQLYEIHRVRSASCNHGSLNFTHFLNCFSCSRTFFSRSDAQKHLFIYVLYFWYLIAAEIFLASLNLWNQFFDGEKTNQTKEKCASFRMRINWLHTSRHADLSAINLCRRVTFLISMTKSSMLLLFVSFWLFIEYLLFSPAFCLCFRCWCHHYAIFYVFRCRCRYNFTIFVNILMRFSIISIFPPIFLLFVAFADAAATFVPVLALRAQDASILA